MAFHDVRFPAALSFGSVGGPERRTEIVALQNGFEERNSPWAQSRRRYDAGLGLRSLDDIETLIAFFEARAGQLHGFRWKDWADYKSSMPLADLTGRDQLLGTGDGKVRAFQLVKRYASGASEYLRTISKPVSGTVVVALDGQAQSPTTDVSVDHTTGIVSFATAPGAGVEVAAGFEFDVPVRFDTDRLAVSIASFRAGEVPTVPVVEIRI